jgi:hypothetical protein
MEQTDKRHRRFAKVVGVFYPLNGVSMFVVWPILLLTDQVPELHTQLVYLMFHLTAEFLTALLCVFTGLSLAVGREWAKGLYYFSTGLSLSAGCLALGRYLLESDIFEWGIVLMLMSLSLITLVFLVVSFCIRFASIQEDYDRLVFLVNGGLVYTLINLAGFMADKGTGYAYGYMGFTMLLAAAVGCLTAVRTAKMGGLGRHAEGIH